MTDVARRIAGPVALTAVSQTLYTVPAATTTIVRGMRVANSASGSVRLTVSIGPDATGTRLYRNLEILPNGIHDWSGFLVLEAGETLRAHGDVTGLTLTASGVEVT